MPWHLTPKKDVTNCDKPWGGVNDLRSTDFRMRELTKRNVLVSMRKYIAHGRAPGELKHLTTRRKRKKTIDSLSSGERKGKSLNSYIAIYMGVMGSHNYDSRRAE